jgi:hypothetical protein
MTARVQKRHGDHHNLVYRLAGLDNPDNYDRSRQSCVSSRCARQSDEMHEIVFRDVTQITAILRVLSLRSLTQIAPIVPVRFLFVRLAKGCGSPSSSRSLINGFFTRQTRPSRDDTVLAMKHPSLGLNGPLNGR